VTLCWVLSIQATHSASAFLPLSTSRLRTENFDTSFLSPHLVATGCTSKSLVQKQQPRLQRLQRQSHYFYSRSYETRRCDSSIACTEKNALRVNLSTSDGSDSAVGRSDVSRLNDPPPFAVTLEGDNYSYRDAVMRTLGWVGAAIVFGGAIWAGMGSETGEEFFAGYLVEQSLSVDNLFVFLLLFEYFKVPLPYQDRVLNWGIYGAIVMRAIMIGLGAAALHQFHGLLLIFAGILIYGSAKFFVSAIFGNEDDEEEDPGQNSIVRFSSSLIDSTNQFDGDRFFTLVDGVRKATPLFICMVAVEISDVVFAVDSIPAVFGVTENPFIVFSSNMFAIMGLRSLYTILSKAATDLKYLEPAVALVLGFIGSKMVAEYFGAVIHTETALAVVATLLGTGIGASVIEKQKALDEE
jgi:TerC family integral membrane protein